MNGTRRLLWYQTLAGGMGGWFGFYEWSEHPYPRQDQLRTVRRFWKNRFHFDMAYSPNFHNEIVMRTDDDRLWVVYGEDTDTFEGEYIQNFMNRPIIAVDTKKEYQELNLKIEHRIPYIIKLPHKSDWVLAIGEFENQ
jgi:hypothetical protein